MRINKDQNGFGSVSLFWTCSKKQYGVTHQLRIITVKHGSTTEYYGLLRFTTVTAGLKPYSSGMLICECVTQALSLFSVNKSVQTIPCMVIDLDEISLTTTFPCDTDLYFFCSRSLNIFWLTFSIKFFFGHVNQYILDTLHRNRPWWYLLNCYLSVGPSPWLFLFKATS